MWLFQHYIEHKGLKEKTNIYFTSAADNLFGVEKYRKSLERLANKRKINELYKHNLVSIKDNIARYEILGTKRKKELKFDFIHVTPPMSAPDFLKAQASAMRMAGLMLILTPCNQKNSIMFLPW